MLTWCVTQYESTKHFTERAPGKNVPWVGFMALIDAMYKYTFSFVDFTLYYREKTKTLYHT